MVKIQRGNQFMRKILSVVIVTCVLTCFGSFSIVALATSLIEVPCAGYNSTNGAVLTSSNTKLSFGGPSIWASYTVTIDAAGIYQLKTNTAAVIDSSMRIYVDTVQECQTTLIKGSDYSTFCDNIIGSFQLSQIGRAHV